MTPDEIPLIAIPPPSVDADQRRQFAAWAEEHGAAILALLRRLCRHASDADDLFQETAVRVWRALASESAEALHVTNVRAWLLTIAYRTFVDHRQQQRRQRTEPLIDHCDPQSSSPDQQAEGRDETQRLLNVVRLLSPEQQELVVLHYASGLTIRETAAAMNLPEGTVKSRLNVILLELRRHLQ